MHGWNNGETITLNLSKAWWAHRESFSLHSLPCFLPHPLTPGEQSAYFPRLKFNNSTPQIQPILWINRILGRCYFNCLLSTLMYFYTLRRIQFSSVAQLCPTLRPHESQRTRPPCPSPTPRVHSNSHPSSQWCHPAISSSVVPFSS